MKIIKETTTMVALGEKFEVPRTYTPEQMHDLLDKDFIVAKKRYFPTWTASWWDEVHFPDSTSEIVVIGWQTNMPKEYLIKDKNGRF